PLPPRLHSRAAPTKKAPGGRLGSASGLGLLAVGLGLLLRRRAAGGGRVGGHHLGRVGLVQVGGVLVVGAGQQLAGLGFALVLAVGVDELVFVRGDRR